MSFPFKVFNRFSGNLQFTAELDAEFENKSYSVQLGAAVKWAFRTGARLDGATLDGATLVGARLDGATLDGATLVGARLVGARLDGATLVGARLVGARLRGKKIVRILARVTRLDGYEFQAYRCDDGSCVIVAGCRGPWTVERYRKHVADEYPGTPKGEETRAILDYVEARDKCDLAANPVKAEAAE